MTESSRREDIGRELARAHDALRAAEMLAQLGLGADSISRAYYAVFHCLRALLLSRGLEPRTHAGAIHLFNVHFVQPGLMPSANNRLIAGLQRSRELADYDAAITFSPEDARAELAGARAFAQATRELLSGEGWLAPETSG